MHVDWELSETAEYNQQCYKCVNRTVAQSTDILFFPLLKQQKRTYFTY